jgi:hypothetical protein
MTNGTLLARKHSNSNLISLTGFEGLKLKLRSADAFFPTELAVKHSLLPAQD